MEGHDKFRGSLRVLAPCFFSPALSIDFCSHTHLLEIMLETIFFTSKKFYRFFYHALTQTPILEWGLIPDRASKFSETIPARVEKGNLGGTEAKPPFPSSIPA